MNKRGRPRKELPRYPSGQVKPEGAGITGASLQRLRSLGTNPILETQVGRLLFLGDITHMEAQAAWRIASIYGRHDRAIGRRRSGASPAYEAGRGCDVGLEESEDQIAWCNAAKRRFNRLQESISELSCSPGVKLRAALETLCVDDQAPLPASLPAVRLALDRLAAAFGLRRAGNVR